MAVRGDDVRGHVSSDEARLIEFLMERFNNADRVWVIHVPEDLRETFKKLFGKKYLTKSEFYEWLESQGYVSSASSGTTASSASTGDEKGKLTKKSANFCTSCTNPDSANRDQLGLHFQSATECKKYIGSATECKEIDYNVLLDAIRNVVASRLQYQGKNPKPAERMALRLAIMHLMRKGKDSLEGIAKGVSEIAAEISQKTDRRIRVRGLDTTSTSNLRNLDGISNYTNYGIEYFEISRELYDEIWQEYYVLMGTAERLHEIRKKVESPIGDESDIKYRFTNFILNYMDGENKRIYLEQLKDVVVNDPARGLVVDWVHLSAFDDALAWYFVESTEADQLLVYFEDAIAELLREHPEFQLSYVPHVPVRIFNLPKTYRPRDVNKEHINRFIQVEGIINRATEVKPFARKAVFVCKDCGNEMIRLQEPFFNMVKPAKCDSCGSRNIDIDVEKSTFENVQFMRIQDIPSQLPGGVLPRHLRMVLREALVDSVKPGDRVVVTGILRVKAENDGKKPYFMKILDVNHVYKINKSIEEVEYTDEDEMEFREAAKKKNFKKKFIRSIAPFIYGNEKLKLGIALAFFGGEEKVLPDGTTVRGRIHVLALGDPGIAKSKILDFAAQLSPKSVRSSGRGASAAGITAAAVRDEITGEWTLEAGVMVLADEGFALIDELDKMREHDRENLHTAMESGVVYINKAGITAELNARATVIAAANPKHGRWNLHKSAAEQVNFKPTILSRFDLIFILIDEPDEKRDRELVRHIRLRYEAPEEVMNDAFDVEWLRKYIAYARRNIHPRMTKEALDLLEDYFVRLRARAKRAGEDGIRKIPITARQLEALIRLSEAHAKMHLREEVTVEDAQAAIELMEYTMKNLNPEKDMDVSVLEVGRPTEELNILDKLMDIVRLLDDGRGAPYSAIVSEAKVQLNISEKEIQHYLDVLREERQVIYLGTIGGEPHYRLAEG